MPSLLEARMANAHLYDEVSGHSLHRWFRRVLAGLEGTSQSLPAASGD